MSLPSLTLIPNSKPLWGPCALVLWGPPCPGVMGPPCPGVMGPLCPGVMGPPVPWLWGPRALVVWGPCALVVWGPRALMLWGPLPWCWCHPQFLGVCGSLVLSMTFRDGCLTLGGCVYIFTCHWTVCNQV